MTDPILGIRNIVMNKIGALCCFHDHMSVGKIHSLINRKLNN